MFTNPPKIFAHISSIANGNFVVPEYILNKGVGTANLFHRFCPHRMYPLADPGTHVEEIHCKFHDFKWDRHGIPINNTKKLSCGQADIGRSGLIFKNFVEPTHRWVDDLAKETNLEYSHSFKGTSKGSWLWLMDAEADLLHVYKNGIHPFLAQQINIEDITMEQGDGWILQNHPTGWWLYIFPFTFVEYGNPGMVMINTVVPHDIKSEYGFDWITQFYYENSVTHERRFIFETLEQVFKEDVAAAEVQRGNYFPLMKAMNRYEDHSVHFGNWFRENKNDTTT
jgi:phenylpropionate dioxygenase-like ring-hydroxylating dioxygenase large terminal subunit